MPTDEHPLTPLEAAHNILGALYYLDPPLDQRFLDLCFSRSDPYIDQVREMVYAERPFWKLLGKPPPAIPFKKE